MSTCISSHGEYSKHEPGEDYVCKLCAEFDEAGALAEIARLRGGSVPGHGEGVDTSPERVHETGDREHIDQVAQAIEHAMRSWEYRWLDDPDDGPAVIARALVEAGLVAPVPLFEETETERVEMWTGEIVREYTRHRWVTEWFLVEGTDHDV